MDLILSAKTWLANFGRVMAILWRDVPALLAIAAVILLYMALGVYAVWAKRAGLKRTGANWLTWPTLEEYGHQNPACMTHNGVKCCHCHGRSLNNHSYARTTLRVVTCNTCNNGLYRV